MRIFYDPIDGPPSQKQILGIVLYLFLALISVWATGESLAKHFDITRIIAYGIGFAIVFVMAAMLSIIKTAILERKIVPLGFGVLSFLFVWLVSITTNTHNFYLKGSLKDIQEKELKEAKKELEGLQIKSFAIVDDMTSNCRRKISKLIDNYVGEVTNNFNKGHGPRADSLKRVVELSMPGSAFVIPSKTPLNSQSQVRSFASKMKKEMLQELEKRIESMLNRKDEIKQLVSTQEYNDIVQNINETLLVFYDSDITQNRNIISQSYSLHNGLVDKVDKILFSGMLECEGTKDALGSLPETPGSIELENISNTYSYVKKTGGFSTSEFLFAFLIALGIDFGAFVIFYLMVLKKRD